MGEWYILFKRYRNGSINLYKNLIYLLESIDPYRNDGLIFEGTHSKTSSKNVKKVYVGLKQC